TVSGAVTGVAAGGLIGALAGLGLPKKTAEVYDETVRQGGVVIGLNQRAEGEADLRAMLEKHGAHDVQVVEIHEPRSDHQPDYADQRTMRREPVFGEEVRGSNADRDHR
ncbi:MAG TPA: hypothetical protein VK963_00415, partial [Candidatus Saccharimonadales bacterium]|nr:hypothetical protein [Candidatus Saccharimonadales bacterium]